MVHIRLGGPAYLHRITQKIRVARQCSLYCSVYDDEYPTEIFLRHNVGPIIKSPAEDQPQDTQQDPSSGKGEDP